MSSNVRLRLGLGSAVLLLIGLLCLELGVHLALDPGSLAYAPGSLANDPGSGITVVPTWSPAPTSYIWSTLLSTLGIFFIVVAAVAAVGVVASLVIEDGLARRPWMDAGHDEVGDESDQETA